MKGGVNGHWFRNFSTLDAEGFDIQFTGADKDKKYETLAFLWAWNDPSKVLSAAPTNECLNLAKASGGGAYTATAFTTAAWDAVSKVEEPVKENTEEPTDGETDDTNKDWAAKTTASAAALLAATYALAF